MHSFLADALCREMCVRTFVKKEDSFPQRVGSEAGDIRKSVVIFGQMHGQKCREILRPGSGGEPRLGKFGILANQDPRISAQYLLPNFFHVGRQD